jgi:urease accessory protein
LSHAANRRRLNLNLAPIPPARIGTTMDIDHLAQLRLFQLISPSLPVGAFAYSQGIEWAVEAGWIDGADSLQEWLGAPLTSSLARVDLPLLLRQHRAWCNADTEAVENWNDYLLACRETAELRAEEAHRARAMAALLPRLGIQAPDDDWAAVKRSQTAGFALAAAHWNIPPAAMAQGYAWAWLENQVLAAVKALPLGQSAGQQVLLHLAALIPQCVHEAQMLGDDEIGASLPALAIASCLHETQYTRLFRS